MSPGGGQSHAKCCQAPPLPVSFEPRWPQVESSHRHSAVRYHSFLSLLSQDGRRWRAVPFFFCSFLCSQHATANTVRETAFIHPYSTFSLTHTLSHSYIHTHPHTHTHTHTHRHTNTHTHTITITHTHTASLFSSFYSSLSLLLSLCLSLFPS